MTPKMNVLSSCTCYPVTAGSKNVYVVVDPNNTIVEANEGDNVVRISQELGSLNPFLDVAGEIAGRSHFQV